MDDDAIDLVTLMGGPALTPAQRRALFRKGPKKRGYAHPPGTGPAGETCATCKHIRRVGNIRLYRKCALVKWTHGAGTDILARSPACAKWEADAAD